MSKITFNEISEEAKATISNVKKATPETVELDGLGITAYFNKSKKFAIVVNEEQAVKIVRILLYDFYEERDFEPLFSKEWRGG